MNLLQKVKGKWLISQITRVKLPPTCLAQVKSSK